MNENPASDSARWHESTRRSSVAINRRAAGSRGVSTGNAPDLGGRWVSSTPLEGVPVCGSLSDPGESMGRPSSVRMCKRHKHQSDRAHSRACAEPLRSRIAHKEPATIRRIHQAQRALHDTKAIAVRHDSDVTSGRQRGQPLCGQGCGDSRMLPALASESTRGVAAQN